jgi:arginine decarboxylase
LHADDAPHAVFGIDRWGKDIITVLPNGDIGLVDPLARSNGAVSLPEIIRNLEHRGIQAPVLLRVSSFLEHGIRRLNESFRHAIEAAGYKGAYRGVFPIKVNQQAQVIQRIVE